jgi:hypothetical protein
MKTGNRDLGDRDQFAVPNKVQERSDGACAQAIREASDVFLVDPEKPIEHA